MKKDDLDKIIVDNLNLIHWTIKKMNLRYDTDDEYQSYYDDGLEGLIKAAPKYDSSKCKASSFFYPCIKNAILHGITIKLANKRFNPNGKDISLYMTLGEEGFELEDVIKDPDINIEEQLIKNEEIERLLYFVEKLPNEKDKLVIKMHYGLFGYEQMTFEKIAKIFKVTKSAVQFRESRSISRLKKFYENSRKEITNV